MPLSADAQTVADLLLRVYEIHERIIARTGRLEARGEAIEPKTIAEIAAWFRQLLQEGS